MIYCDLSNHVENRITDVDDFRKKLRLSEPSAHPKVTYLRTPTSVSPTAFGDEEETWGLGVSPTQGTQSPDPPVPTCTDSIRKGRSPGTGDG